MFSTDNQAEFKTEITLMAKEQGEAFTAGYLSTVATEMLALLPKRKQKEFIKQLEEFNGRQLVEVRNLMTGEMVMQARNTPRSCDVSSELYWSM